MDSASARTGTGGRAAGSRSDAKKGRAGGLTSKHVGGHKPTLAASTTASTSHLHEVKSTAKPEGLSCKETFQRKRGTLSQLAVQGMAMTFRYISACRWNALSGFNCL